MFNVGEMVVYDKIGVCQIEDICYMKANKVQPRRKYYKLSPLYQDGNIYCSVETKVFMRPIISKEDAENLIDSIPFIKAKAYTNKSVQQLAQHYNNLINTNNCADLMEMTMSIYAKKECALQQKKKLGSVDEKFMKRAEDLLFGEFAATLGIEKEDVTKYISNRLGREDS